MRGSNSPSAKLTDDDVAEIRRLYSDRSQTTRSIGDRFQIVESTVTQIATGKKWSHLPGACQKELEEVVRDTADYSRMTMTLALSYSGRWDITQTIRSLAEKVSTGDLRGGDIDEAMVSSSLSTAEFPDPDLLIRTGGERRISNYMLWEMAYTELHFSPVFWPDFRRKHLYEAIRDFQDRERRYGRVLNES